MKPLLCISTIIPTAILQASAAEKGIAELLPRIAAAGIHGKLSLIFK
jgi:hypothetical protein